MPRPLDCHRELPLVPCTSTRHAPGHDLASIGHGATQKPLVFVVNPLDSVFAEAAPPSASSIYPVHSCHTLVFLPKCLNEHAAEVPNITEGSYRGTSDSSNHRSPDV